MKAAAVTGLLLIVLYAGACSYLASRVWTPVRHPLRTTPAAYGLAFTDIEFASAVDHVPLRGWLIDPHGPDRRGTILVLHGSNSVRDNYISMEVARGLAAHGYGIFIFDFRGHGTSGGTVGSLGQLETRDIAGALDYLKGQGIGEVGVIGYSMGASAELLAAPDHPEMRALVTDSAFADLSTVLDLEREKAGVPALFGPGTLLAGRILYGVDPEANRPRLAMARLKDRPILLIHSSNDDLVPVGEDHKLRDAGAGNPDLTLWIVQSTWHVASFASDPKGYIDRLTAFFDKYVGRSQMNRAINTDAVPPATTSSPPGAWH